MEALELRVLVRKALAPRQALALVVRPQPLEVAALLPLLVLVATLLPALLVPALLPARMEEPLVLLVDHSVVVLVRQQRRVFAQPYLRFEIAAGFS
jgi:hypothetical protein